MAQLKIQILLLLKKLRRNLVLLFVTLLKEKLSFIRVSKLGKLKYKNESQSVQDVKARDLRQMFLPMTEEVRVIIDKLADRLHNMRTLSHMPSHKQSSIATETLQVFASLAKLLGMYQIKHP